MQGLIIIIGIVLTLGFIAFAAHEESTNINNHKITKLAESVQSVPGTNMDESSTRLLAPDASKGGKVDCMDGIPLQYGNQQDGVLHEFPVDGCKKQF